MLYTIFTILFIVVSLILALFILIQSDKGGGISGAIGGGMSNANTVLGAQNTENILTKGTTYLVIAFFVIATAISFFLAGMHKAPASSESILKQTVEATTEAPMTPQGGTILPTSAPVEEAPAQQAPATEAPAAE